MNFSFVWKLLGILIDKISFGLSLKFVSIFLLFVKTRERAFDVRFAAGLRKLINGRIVICQFRVFISTDSPPSRTKLLKKMLAGKMCGK